MNIFCAIYSREIYPREIFLANFYFRALYAARKKILKCEKIFVDAGKNFAGKTR